MSEHNHPPSTHTRGIRDDCPRCQEYAARPTDMDERNLRRIWRGEHHTRNDVLAFGALYRAVVITQRLGEAFAVEAWEAAGGSVGTMGDDGAPSLGDFAKPDAFELFKVGGRA